MKRARVTFCIMVGLGLSLIADIACTPAPGGGDRDPVATSLFLNEGLGTFDVEAGVPETRAGTVMFRTSGGQLQGGTIELNPDELSVTVGAAKDAVRFQGGALTVTVWVAEIDAQDTVCETGEQYGPYAVTLDENNEPVSVAPPTVELTETTLGLLEAGEFSICIEVISPIDATVTIDSFQINLEF